MIPRMNRLCVLTALLALCGLAISCRKGADLPVDKVTALSAAQCALMEQSLT